jgi:GMP synthase (glutamine-hydrolysing)
VSPESTVLVIEHQADCGIDRLGEWLGELGIHLEVRRPYLGDAVPERVSDAGADALVVLGGSMGANDDAKHAWLAPTRALQARAVADGVPGFGICLGAQLLAVALGGRVEVGAAGIEPGVVNVRWRPEAEDDELFGGLPDPFPGPSMHQDSIVELPQDARWLGETPMYPHQVFRVGDVTWGVQFHPEVGEATFRSWTPECAEAFAKAGTDADSVVAELVDRDDEVVTAGRMLAARFAAVVRQAAGS